MKKLVLALIVLTSSSAFAQNFFNHTYFEYLDAKESTGGTNDDLVQKVITIIDSDNAVSLERLIHSDPKVLNIEISQDLCQVDDCNPALYAAWKSKKQTLKVLVRHNAILSIPGTMPGESGTSIDGVNPTLAKQVRAEVAAEKKSSSYIVPAKHNEKEVLKLVKDDNAAALDAYLVQYPNAINHVDGHWSLLQWACQVDHQRPNAAKVLLRHGMDPSLPQEDKEQDGQGLDEPSPANLAPTLIDKLEAELKAETK